jgi:hypothetical protein
MKPYLLFFSVLLHLCIVNAQNRYDIVIDEIMADPSPPTGLPNNEWIELKNSSRAAINLSGWRIGDGSGLSGPMRDFILQPDSCVIICPASAVTSLSVFGHTIAVTSFPSLDNEGEMIFLKDANGMTIHAVDYSTSWYRNELKNQGGWSLEMIDTGNPCSASSNWKASTDPKGGTPGKPNSVNAVNKDENAPELKSAYTNGDSIIVIVYTEPVDSASGATAANYGIDGGLSFTAAIPLPPYFNSVQLKLNASLWDNFVYTLTVSGVSDCTGNKISSATLKTGIALVPHAGDLVINEILFDPLPDGYDYIEFFNTSNKIIDASELYIANRSSTNMINAMIRISATPIYIFPGEYFAVTEDADNLALHYFVKQPAAVISLASLPSFPDDKGSVILLNRTGEITDEVRYNEDWHFKLLNSKEGVALERIDPTGLSQQATNWHSAASSAGFGTPGYKNSQYSNSQPVTGNIEISPAVFSPDNDGIDDIARISYTIGEPGYVANITIFDAAGRVVKNLVRNETLGHAGYWNWNGLNDRHQKLPVGIYIILTEIFNLQGKKEQFKRIIVLGRKV